MKQRLAQIGLVVVILVALAFVVKQSKPKQYTYERILVDTVANKVFVLKIPVGESLTFPTTSPFSQGNNAYPAIKCMQDGTIFAFEEPNLEGDGPPPLDPEAIMPKCPVCGGGNIDVPEIPEGQKNMDVPGPVKIVLPGGKVKE